MSKQDKPNPWAAVPVVDNTGYSHVVHMQHDGQFMYVARDGGGKPDVSEGMVLLDREHVAYLCALAKRAGWL